MSSMVRESLMRQIERVFLRGDDPALTQPDRIELIAIDVHGVYLIARAVIDGRLHEDFEGAIRCR